MMNHFKEEWLRKIPTGDFIFPEEYNLMNFTNWERKHSFDPMNDLSNGHPHKYGEIFKLEDGLAGKYFKEGPFFKRGGIFNNFPKNLSLNYFLEREFYLGKLLKESSVNVPIYHGLNLIFNKILEEYRPAMVMERIDFLDPKEFEPSDWEYLAKFRDKEIEKADKAGFIIGDDVENLGNSLISKRGGTVYLIDFMSWGIK